MTTLTITQVSNIARLAKSTPERDRSLAYRTVQRCDELLRAAAAEQLVLADGVRLPLPAIINLIWTIRKHALGQWKLAKQAEVEAQVAKAQEEFLAAVRCADGAELAEVA